MACVVVGAPLLAVDALVLVLVVGAALLVLAACPLAPVFA